MNHVAIDRDEHGGVMIRLAGEWSLQRGLAPTSDVESLLARESRPLRITFDTKGLGLWDSSLLVFLAGVSSACRRRGGTLDGAGLPRGLNNLLGLAEAVPEAEGAHRDQTTPALLQRIGESAIRAIDAAREALAFVGNMTLSGLTLVRLKARYRASDLWLLIQQCGVDALPIVTLISFLAGVILAFIGAVQLKRFGAQLYVADLVGIAMTREMGALMTAIIMSGRTGAAFAAELGTMKVTQELDALGTAGFSVLEFLVLPRVLALVLMMPLLCLYADLVGIVGGVAIGAGMLDLSLTTYIKETVSAVTLRDTFGGAFKSAVYGLLIAAAGCWRGLQAGSSASGVGTAATSAVVSSLVAIIVACGLFAFVFYTLGM